MARGEGEGEGIEEGEGVARRGWHAVGGGLGGGLSCKARGRLRARRTAPEDDAYGTRSGRRRCESPSGDVTPLVGALSFVLKSEGSNTSQKLKASLLRQGRLHVLTFRRLGL